MLIEFNKLPIMHIQLRNIITMVPELRIEYLHRLDNGDMHVLSHKLHNLLQCIRVLELSSGLVFGFRVCVSGLS